MDGPSHVVLPFTAAVTDSMEDTTKKKNKKNTAFRILEGKINFFFSRKEPC